MANAPLYLYDDPNEYLSFDEAPTNLQSRDQPPAEDAKSLPPVLRIAEAARLLRVNRKTLYELVQKNALPGARRVGRVIRIDRATIEEWMRGQTGMVESSTKQGRVVSPGGKHGGTTR